MTQPRISDLIERIPRSEPEERHAVIRGKINLFALDAPVKIATAGGLHIEMRVMEAA